MNNEWEKEIEKVAEYVGGEPADGFLPTADIVKEIKELVSKILASERASWLRSEIEKLEDEKFVWLSPEEMKEHDGCRYERNGLYVGQVAGDNFNRALTSIITRYKEELKVLGSK